MEQRFTSDCLPGLYSLLSYAVGSCSASLLHLEISPCRHWPSPDGPALPHPLSSPLLPLARPPQRHFLISLLRKGPQRRLPLWQIPFGLLVVHLLSSEEPSGEAVVSQASRSKVCEPTLSSTNFFPFFPFPPAFPFFVWTIIDSVKEA